MKKLYLILLMLLLLFIPTSINAVAIYQLDQPIKELDNYTLRQVFNNRNMARPDLSFATYLGEGNYNLSTILGVARNYNVNTGILSYNGTTTSSNIVLNAFNVGTGFYTFNLTYLSGGVSGNVINIQIYNNGSFVSNTPLSNGNNFKVTYNFTGTSDNTFRIVSQSSGYTYNNYQFKLQIEAGSIATPYQVSTSGPYNQFEFNYLDLTPEQIQTYYDLYLEAVRFEEENVQASQDNGGYQNIFKAIINGVKNLMVEMGYVWQWLNAPIITSDMSNYQFNIDWSWDLIGVVRQILNSAGILVLQITFWVPSLAFSFMGIPVHVSILSLLFSNLIFLLLGWIMVKSFLI